MKLELTDEQRYVLELAVDEQITALERTIDHKRLPRPGITSVSNPFVTEPVDHAGLRRRRDILERLLIDLRYPI